MKAEKEAMDLFDIYNISLFDSEVTYLASKTSLLQGWAIDSTQREKYITFWCLGESPLSLCYFWRAGLVVDTNLGQWVPIVLDKHGLTGHIWWDCLTMLVVAYSVLTGGI